jgi:hypothetical protein
VGSRRTTAVAAGAIPAGLVLTLLAGCAGDGGRATSAAPSGTVTLAVTPAATASAPAGEDAIALVDAVRAALETAESVAVTGEVTTPAGTSSLQLQLHRSGATGTVVSEGERVEVRRLRESVYVRSDSEAPYARLLGPGEAAAARGSWVRTTMADPRLAGLPDLLSLDRVAGWAVGANLSARDADVTVGGRPAAALRNPATGARLLVPLQAPLYPFSVERQDADVRGRLSYSAWNAPVEIVVPAEVRDLTG